MKAVYHKNPAYLGNPFIEAMLTQMDAGSLMQSLKQVPVMGDEIRTMSSGQRIAHTSKVMEVFVPLSYTPLMYNLIYQGIVSSYANKNTVDTVKQMMRIRESLAKGVAPSTLTYTTQAASASILGVPGIGKTTTIRRILDTIPQVIEHEQYNGEMMFCKQITHLFIQTPNDCSVKGVCIQLLAEMDRLLSTSYAPKGQAGRGQTVDALVAKISQLCLTHHVGVIVIDEIQNVVTINKHGGFDSRLIKFFVQLMNDTGVSVILVGTPEIGAFFDQQPHLARRTRGLRIGALEFGAAFESLVRVLWEQQVTNIYEPLSEELMRLLYEVSGGVPALVAQLLCYAQQYAITSGKERLSMKVLKETVVMYQLRKPSSIVNSTSASTFMAKEQPRVKDTVQEGKTNRGRPSIGRDVDDIISLYENNDYDGLMEQLRIRDWIKMEVVC